MPVLLHGKVVVVIGGTSGIGDEIACQANLGIGALVAGLAYEMAPHHRVNAVAPTFMGTGTAFWRDVPPDELERLQARFSQRVPLKRVGTVCEVASTYLHLMINTFVTGQVLAVDGGVMLDK